MKYLKYLREWVKSHGFVLKAPVFVFADREERCLYDVLLSPWQFYKQRRELEFWRQAARDRKAIKEGNGSHKMQQFRDKYNRRNTLLNKRNH